MHYLITNTVVSKSYIYQVKKYAQIKSNSWFSIQMISSIKSTPPIPFLYILITSGQGTWIFDVDLFCQRGTVGFVAISSSLLNRIAIECLYNHLPQATLLEYKYSKLPLFILMSTGISSILSLSFWAVPIPYKPLS